MHHPRQAGRFGRLGMFTRRCRLRRPQPETERTDHRLFGAERIRAGARQRDGEPPWSGPPDSPTEAFCPDPESFSSNGGQNPHRSPLLGWKQSLVGSMSTVSPPLVLRIWTSQDKSPVSQKDLQMEQIYFNLSD